VSHRNAGEDVGFGGTKVFALPIVFLLGVGWSGSEELLSVFGSSVFGLSAFIFGIFIGNCAETVSAAKLETTNKNAKVRILCLFIANTPLQRIKMFCGRPTRSASAREQPHELLVDSTCG